MNWKQRVELAEERGYFSEEDRELVGHWDSCYIGERLKIKHDDGLEVSKKGGRSATVLGLDFSRAVVHQDIKKAKEICSEIRKKIHKRFWKKWHIIK